MLGHELRIISRLVSSGFYHLAVLPCKATFFGVGRSGLSCKQFWRDLQNMDPSSSECPCISKYNATTYMITHNYFALPSLMASFEKEDAHSGLNGSSDVLDGLHVHSLPFQN